MNQCIKISSAKPRFCLLGAVFFLLPLHCFLCRSCWSRRRQCDWLDTWFRSFQHLSKFTLQSTVYIPWENELVVSICLWQSVTSPWPTGNWCRCWATCHTLSSSCISVSSSSTTCTNQRSISQPDSCRRPVEGWMHLKAIQSFPAAYY